MNKNAYEKLLWSIALPGFGQLLNGKYIKGAIFILLEFLINIKANFNEAIMSSFLGDVELTIQQLDYSWIMFYPCLYFFAMWDAFKDAGGAKDRFSYLPFVFCAYTVTVGVMYSSKLIFGILFGPIWLPILAVFPGLLIGVVLRKMLLKMTSPS